jgi:hypothetical protein
LVDKDWLSKSDPIVILQEKKKPEDPWTFIGRTELIRGNQNPDFQEKIVLVCTSIFLSLRKAALWNSLTGSVVCNNHRISLSRASNTFKSLFWM